MWNNYWYGVKGAEIMKKPEFNGTVKDKRREHKTFGGYVVEYLYGATDADGYPVEPREGADDGN